VKSGKKLGSRMPSGVLVGLLTFEVILGCHLISSSNWSCPKSLEQREMPAMILYSLATK